MIFLRTRLRFFSGDSSPDLKPLAQAAPHGQLDHFGGDRRSAHRRVGAATIVAFVALLLLGATRGPAQAETTTPAPVPAATTVPEQVQPAPADPQQTVPGRPDPGFDPDGGGRDGGRGFGGGRRRQRRRLAAGGGGVAPSVPAPTAPAPSTGGSQT